MNDFDSVRLNLQSRLISAGLDEKTVDLVIGEWTIAMEDYDIVLRSTAIIPYVGIPKSVDEYLASLQMEGREKGTIKNYQKILYAMFECLKKSPEELEYRDIWGFLLKYQESREKPITNRTANQYLGYIKYYFSWLQDVGYITNNPTKSIKPIHFEKKQRKSLTRHDLIQVIKSCQTERERAVITLMYSTGCRISEMCSMKLADIDWRERRIKVLGKGKKERFVFINDQAEIYLSEYLATRHDESPFVFVSARGHHGITTDSMRKWIESVCGRVTDISVHATPHTIRHTFATLGIQSGLPVTSMQTLLGHEDVSTTMEYVDMSHISVQQEFDKHII